MVEITGDVGMNSSSAAVAERLAPATSKEQGLLWPKTAKSSLEK